MGLPVISLINIKFNILTALAGVLGARPLLTIKTDGFYQAEKMISEKFD